MERILVKNLVRNKTCYNCDYFRRFADESCICSKYTRPNGEQKSPEGGFKIPKEKTCEYWKMSENMTEGSG